MHMADSLVSPAVGGIIMSLTTGVAGYSIKKIKTDIDSRKIPLMGIMGAFVFAAQMINFAIPGTGSSGHLGGGMLLAILLGPYAGFITMASILFVQAFIFADGGLLAFGCNVFNLGFFTCFIAYPLIYRLFLKDGYSKKRIFYGSMIASVIGLQLGALSVVIQTMLSGITELSFGIFLMWMQPIHLAIGIVEGFVTYAVVAYVWQQKPEIFDRNASEANNYKKLIVALLSLTVFVGGLLSWFASSSPDGLEWSMEKTAKTTEIKSNSKIHKFFENIQSKVAILPDYTFRQNDKTEVTTEQWPNVSAGTTSSGIMGGGITLLIVVVIGSIIKLCKKKKLQI